MSNTHVQLNQRTQDVLGLMKKHNKDTIDEMRDAEEGNEVCPAHSGLRKGIERVISNQEFHIERTLNGGSEKKQKKIVKLGPLTLSGFESRDIMRIVGLGALIWIILRNHGIDPITLLMK